MRLGSLFSGYGGLDIAAECVFGASPVWFADNEPAAAAVLAHHYPHVPNLGDITAVDWPAVEPVDVLTGGFPCQDVSSAGKRAGMRPDTRSGLWTHMARAIAVLRPQVVVAENVRGLLSAAADSAVEPCPWCLGDGRDEPHVRALGAVLGDLAELGYDAAWHGLRAADVGAPHGRFRVFVVATDTRGETVPLGSGLRASEPGRIGWRRSGDDSGAAAADADGDGREGQPERDGEPRNERSPQRDDAHGRVLDCGQYGPAVERWEHLTGRVAPAPTEFGARGGAVLSPPFVEWLMGLPDGHVTDVPGLKRAEQLRLLGNGVVPQQASAALDHLAEVIA
ncbi:hypothetical protein BJF85_16640 [Saccharomonospora sp. CUA-673]|uniref:DNA cytosine methyltransferase n=1 Tax=Saccharomonospora sp. CUA-673 TaxID=1904969 RepID=UPI00095BA78E|nr:DNA cytosine methyltransferase [Saccharomonospora sp. CUA-673]OLT46472.1 hypothetical protein BJF85_16640 [Saccharomonospora sp. CUA-673]